MKTLHSYQDQRGAVLLSASTPYFNHSFVNNPSSTSLWGEGIGNSVSSFVQTTENKLSQWFWQSISALPKGYFSAKDITSVNHFDKSLWEGMFNERVEDLKEQLKSTLTLQQKDFHYQILSENEHANIDKLKEQMAAGLPNNDKLSLKEQLTALQGLVGKHTLSPQDYEDGLDGLKEAAPDNNYYATLIEQVRSSFRSTLKTHQGLLEECLQSDLIRLFKESSEKSLTSAPLKKILRYYKPLMKHKQYAKQREWIEQCYNTQSLLPIPSARKHITRLPSRDLSNIENKQDSPTWGSCIRNLGKLLWDNSGKLMTLGLATQVTAVQAFNNRAQGDLVPEGNLTDRSSMMLDINQTFPTVNTTLLGLNEGYVPNPSSELDTLMPQNTSAEESTTTDGYEVDNKVVTRLINATDISNAEPYDRHMEVDPVMSQNKSIEERVAADIYGLDDKVVALPINSTGISEVDQHDLHVGISEVLRQEILRQFDIINTDLQELSKKFSTNEDNNKPLEERSNQTTLARVIRFLPLDESSTCEVEQATLINFRSELQATLNGSNQAGNNNCPLNYNSDTCEELVKLVLCGYNHLKNGFIQATRNSVAIGEATMWENKLNEYKEKSTRLFNDKIKSLSGKYDQEIADLETKMQKLQKQANLYLKTIKGDVLEVCAYRITDGNIQGAVDKFKQLSNEFKMIDETIIISIIREVYKLERVENIIKFVRYLPAISHGIIGLSSLFEKMRNNGDLNSYQLLMLAYRVKEYMEMYNYANAAPAQGYYDNKFTTLKNNLPTSVSRLIWCGNQCAIKNTRYSEYLYAANDYFKFDSKRRRVFTWKPGGNVDQGYWKFKTTDNAKSFAIKNTNWGDYLYAANDYFEFDSKRRRVFTWMPGGNVDQGYWKLEPVDVNNGKFRIKNTYYRNCGEYLYAADNSFKLDSKRRRVFTWQDCVTIENGKDVWEIDCNCR